MNISIDEPNGGVQDPQESETRLRELEEQLASGVRRERTLKRQLATARQEATALKMAQQQIFASSSWRLTAPLRAVRTLLGAPPPLTMDPVAVAGDSTLGDELAVTRWNSLIPQPVPESIISVSPDVAARSNEPCVIVRPEKMLDGLVPAALLGDDPGSTGTVYHGSEANPPRIAFLGSPELAQELAFDAVVTSLAEDGWESQIESGDFDLLLLEPVWHVGNREWRNAMIASGQRRSGVESLLERARERGLPRVLWYRGSAEDAGFFGWLLQRVEKGYAIDDASAAALQAAGERPVAILGPAIQPALDNPLRSWDQLALQAWRQHVLYDGWLDLMEGAAAEPLLQTFRDDRLLVAESEWEFGGVRLADCPDFRTNALGCLDRAGKASVAKIVGAEVFRSTPLVPAWRRRTMMMRALASGTLVADLSDDNLCFDGLPLRTENAEMVSRIRQLLDDPLARGRLQHGAIREILGQHCLSDRLDRIAADLKLDVRFGRRPATVAFLLVTMRPQLLAACLERFRNDRYPHKELVVVLHGRDASLQEARSLVRTGERISIYQVGRELSLGACLNFAAAQSDADYWAKVDDDDIYGPNYLSDLMMYRKAVDFRVGGKTAAFVYSKGEDAIRFDPAYAATRSWQYRRAGRGERVHIAGGTLIGHRDVLQDVPFSATRRRGSDSDFLRRSDAAGYDFTAFDFFNFALFRSDAPGFHTWNADADDIVRRTSVVGTGAEIDKVVWL